MSIVSNWVSEEVLALSAYHVPPAGNLLKLDAMENPYPLPEQLHSQWVEALSAASFNRYPDPAAAALKLKISEIFNVPENAGMILGNGSDELIQMVAYLVGGKDRIFISPEPSFSMYRLIAKASSTQYIECRLNDDFSIEAENLLSLVRDHNPACVFLAYPNNPTGKSMDVALIEQVIRSAPGLVVVDEAYFSFSQRTMLSELDQFENLLVMRTLSKSGLAGLRLGMMMGSPQWIAELEKIRLPYNINTLTQISARFCLDHFEVFEEQTAKIRSNRSFMLEQLEKISGLTVYPSDTNFILVRLHDSADKTHALLKEKGILVKNLHGSDPALDQCLRLTVGTMDECTQLLEALADSI